MKLKDKRRKSTPKQTSDLKQMILRSSMREKRQLPLMAAMSAQKWEGPWEVALASAIEKLKMSSQS
jgi:hypothetical protein